MNSILELNNISKNYHSMSGIVKAIDSVSLTIDRGKFYVIVGPSGCGKSTLLNIVGGIDSASDGDIILEKNIGIGYMLQSDCLFPWLTIYDNCLVGLKVKGLCNNDNINYVKELIKEYGLNDFMMKYPNSLSGGMKQRVALIRTLSLKPDILLLDEPFSALDYQTRLKVCDDVYKIIKNTGKTVIMITHDLEEAITVGDTVIILSNRPAKIKRIVNIEMDDRSTPINNRKCKKFPYYFDLIWNELNSDG